MLPSPHVLITGLLDIYSNRTVIYVSCSSAGIIGYSSPRPRELNLCSEAILTWKGLAVLRFLEESQDSW